MGTVPTQSSAAPPPSKLGLAICYLTQFMCNLGTCNAEAISPVSLQRLFGWGPCRDPEECEYRIQQSYTQMAVMGAGLLSTFWAFCMAAYLGKYVYKNEVKVMAFGMGCQTVASFIMIDFGGYITPARFIASLCIGCMGATFISSTNMSLLSQILGPHDKAKYMGYLFAVGAVPRVIGPYLLIQLLTLPPPMEYVDWPHVYTGPKPRMWLISGFQCVSYFFVLLLLIAGNKQLKRQIRRISIYQRTGEDPYEGLEVMMTPRLSGRGC